MTALEGHEQRINLKFDFSPDDEAFRLEVRGFLRANLPPAVAEEIRRWTNPTVAGFRVWQAILAKKGWGARKPPQRRAIGYLE